MTKPDLSAAYAASVPDKQQRRLAALAETYTPNALYDRLLARRAAGDEAAFIGLTTHSLRMALGHYAEAKRAHEELQAHDRQ